MIIWMFAQSLTLITIVYSFISHYFFSSLNEIDGDDDMSIMEDRISASDALVNNDTTGYARLILFSDFCLLA